MKLIGLLYESWFMNRQENWDHTTHLMVVGGDERLVILAPWQNREIVKEKFPDMELTNITVSVFRGKIERNARLRTEWPEHWRLINETWMAFEDA